MRSWRLPDEVLEHGSGRVIVGEYGGLTSPIATPPTTYLVVSLEDGERWISQPPAATTWPGSR